MSNKSETKTENFFRKFYGTSTFIEKAAIPKTCGFKSKRGTVNIGYPDFFREEEEYAIVVEAKADDMKAAEDDLVFYMTKNSIKKDILGIAISGQSKSALSVSYWLRLFGNKEIVKLQCGDGMLSLNSLQKVVHKSKYKEKISAESLITTLKYLNKRFHDKNKVSVTNRSLFFSGLLIALTDNNFRKTFRLIEAPTKKEVQSKSSGIIESEKLNKAVLDAITNQISSKVNNLSKKYNWEDKFSFIKLIDYALAEYKEIIEIVEKDVYAPFQSEEKQDILGRAYKIFLSRAGSIEEKNIIITPDHVKRMMVKLARVTKDDVVLDTCIGTGGFLMDAMETMIIQAEGNPVAIERIKENQLIGFEVEPTLFALACTNMFLHGDGRSNLIFRSSLLDDDKSKIVNRSDKDLKRLIKSAKPTKVIINPPYESNYPIKFTMQALNFLEPNGRLVIIMPTPTLKQNQNGMTEKILKIARLDFVIKMPNGLFTEQGRTVNTSIFGFTKCGKHQENDEVIFYTLEDDGLVSVQHKGRIDKHNRWGKVEATALQAINSSREIEGICEKKEIYKKGLLNCYGFSKLMDNGSVMLKISDLFNCDEVGSISSENADGGNGSESFDFITASEEWKKHSVATHDKEAIIFAIGASGSLGRTHYVKGKFSASNLCLILTPKKGSKYKVNLKFYNYYFANIRKKLVSDLADGTSKLTIRPQDLGEYYIEYIDYNEQKRFVSSHVRKLEQLKQQYEDKLEITSNEMHSLLLKR